jgi:hypothetical protein
VSAFDRFDEILYLVENAPSRISGEAALQRRRPGAS